MNEFVAVILCFGVHFRIRSYIIILEKIKTFLLITKENHYRWCDVSLLGPSLGPDMFTEIYLKKNIYKNNSYLFIIRKVLE